MNFIQIPDEIIQHIYSYLNLKDSKRLSLTSVKFKTIYKEIDKFTLYQEIKSYQDFNIIKNNILNNLRYIKVNNEILTIINIIRYLDYSYSIICKEGEIIYLNNSQKKILVRDGKTKSISMEKYNEIKIIYYSKFIYRCKELEGLNKRISEF